MDIKANTQRESIFSSALAVLFIGLKLAGIINWSWWWVLAPLWAPLAIVLSIIVIWWLFFGD